MTDKKVAKVANKFVCEKCDYSSNKLSNYQKHLKTKKHNTDIMATNTDTGKMSLFCVCGKKYKHRQSLFNHKLQCSFINTYIIDVNEDNVSNNVSNHELTDMFIKLMEKNEELMEKITEVAKEPKIINNTTNNTQFNVMNYLNNECKDAMNFTDFIDTFEFTIDDLKMLGNKGYQETMERTFIKQLKDMDKTMRPIHCSDRKRKSFYVKENGVWRKDDENKSVVRGVKRIASRHFTTIHKWREYNPDCFDDVTKHLFFNKAMGQVSKCDNEKQMKKVINHLSGLSLKD